MSPNVQDVTGTVVTKPSDREIKIERVFNAPRSLVWRAFTEKDLIKEWWGRGNKLVVEKLEMKKGGHWRFVEHGPEGVHGFEGRFAEVTPESRIVMTFEWDGMPGFTVRETMVLEEIGTGRTKVVNISLFYSPNERDGMQNSGMEQGLNESYAALDRLLEKLQK